jgi:Domain of unknown function (DUF1844)
VEGSGASDLTFSGFVLSLASAAAVHFGDLPDPATGRRGDTDLDAAARVIELLSMLQQKTKGNLIEQEAKLVDDLLYDLRLRFVQAQQGDKRIVEP